jgi:hypothetical protein
VAHKQLYPSYRFHPDGREQIVQTPADDAALTAEDARWINRPPNGVAHDLAWAERQPAAAEPSEPADITTDQTETKTPAELAPDAPKAKSAKRAKAGSVDKP